MSITGLNIGTFIPHNNLTKNYYCPHFIVEETKTSEIKYGYLISHHIQIWNVQLKSLYFFTKISPRKAHWNAST